MNLKRAKYSVPSTQYRLLVSSAILQITACLAFAAPPKVNHLFPAGCQRGQSVVVTAAGDFSTWPAQVWADRAGVSFTAEKDKGKFKAEVAGDAVPGVYWLRMHT